MRKPFFLLLASIGMAYPLGGIAFVICRFFSQVDLFGNHLPWSNLLFSLFFGIIYAAIKSCMACGFLEKVGSGTCYNLYPYIIPIAIVLFIIMYKPWLQIKPRDKISTKDLH